MNIPQKGPPVFRIYAYLALMSTWFSCKTNLPTFFTLLQTKPMSTFLTSMQIKPMSVYIYIQTYRRYIQANQTHWWKSKLCLPFWLSCKPDMCLPFLTLSQMKTMSTSFTFIYRKPVSSFLTPMLTKPICVSGASQKYVYSFPWPYIWPTDIWQRDIWPKGHLTDRYSTEKV